LFEVTRTGTAFAGKAWGERLRAETLTAAARKA
jgi:hypothetical protein